MAGYVYNPFGIRVRSDTTTTINQGSPVAKKKAFVIDANNGTGYAQVLEEKDGTGALTMSYTIGDDVIAQSGPSVTHHFGYDGHGSTRILTDDSAAIESGTRYNYDAYGVSLGSQPSTLNPPLSTLLYTGEQFDVDLQQYYLRARYYDQSRGRFTQIDAFGGSTFDPQSLHKYLYAHTDPVNSIDPTGHFTLVELLVVATIVVVLAAIVYQQLGRRPRREPSKLVPVSTNPSQGRTFLMLHGGVTDDIFLRAAQQRAAAIKSDPNFIVGVDQVVLQKVTQVHEFANALASNTRIVELTYFGHSGPGVLYLSEASGKDFNLSEKGGPMSDAGETTPISLLPTHNLLPEARVYLDGCRTSMRPEGAQKVWDLFYGEGTGNSIAQSFANHFQRPVRGVKAGLNFDDTGPYVRMGRYLLEGGPLWQWFEPESDSQ